MEQKEEALCTNCGKPNIPGNDFCTKCGCPMNSYAQIDPIKRIRTYGFMFRSIMEASDRPVILVGGWIILAPPAIYAYLLVIMGGCANLGEFFQALLIFIFCYSALFLLTRNYFVRRRHK